MAGVGVKFPCHETLFARLQTLAEARSCSAAKARVTRREGVLAEYAKLAAEGRFTVPIARAFPIDDWREALGASLSGHAHGKLVLLPADAA